MDAVHSFVWTVEDLLVDDNRLTVRLTDTGRPVRQWLDLLPTGSSVTFAEYAFFHFHDNRIEHMWYQLDYMTIAQQLNATQPSGGQ
jgi:predicted ester cyclase